MPNVRDEAWKCFLEHHCLVVKMCFGVFKVFPPFHVDAVFEEFENETQSVLESSLLQVPKNLVWFSGVYCLKKKDFANFLLQLEVSESLSMSSFEKFVSCHSLLALHRCFEVHKELKFQVLFSFCLQIADVELNCNVLLQEKKGDQFFEVLISFENLCSESPRTAANQNIAHKSVKTSPEQRSIGKKLTLSFKMKRTVIKSLIFRWYDVRLSCVCWLMLRCISSFDHLSCLSLWLICLVTQIRRHSFKIGSIESANFDLWVGWVGFDFFRQFLWNVWLWVVLRFDDERCWGLLWQEHSGGLCQVGLGEGET